MGYTEQQLATARSAVPPTDQDRPTALADAVVASVLRDQTAAGRLFVAASVKQNLSHQFRKIIKSGVVTVGRNGGHIEMPSAYATPNGKDHGRQQTLIERMTLVQLQGVIRELTGQRNIYSVRISALKRVEKVYLKHRGASTVRDALNAEGTSLSDLGIDTEDVG